MMSVLVAYFRTLRVQIAALLYFLIAGVLTQVPLFNYLGYEFSALMTIPTAFISGIITIQFLREHKVKQLPRRTWFIVVRDYLHINFLLLLIPLAVMTLNAISVKNCNVIKGIAYYTLLPICTMFFSVALALVIGVLFRRGILVFCFAVIGILTHIIYTTYTQPQLFAYNFILGFFPGITYDETLSSHSTLILYREFTVVTVFMLLALFAILVSGFNPYAKLSMNIQGLKENLPYDKKLWIVAGICFSVIFTGHFFRNAMGFEFTSGDIQAGLGRRSEADHFIIYYSSKDYSASEISKMKAECEFYFEEAARMMQLRNMHKQKISLYIYPDSEMKRKFIGTSNTNIAKPWRSEIHLTKNSFRSTFRHELVHALAADFGFPVICASTRMGLNEGLAVAIDWNEGLFTPHQYAAALLREKYLENVEPLFTISGFAVQSSSYAYIVSGSFCKFLIERFGIERFKNVFPSGNFVMAFGEGLGSLIKDWKVFLRTVNADAIPQATVKVMFLQPSIFYKTCAREVAEQNDRAVRAVRVKNYLLAETEFNASYDNAPTVYALTGLFHTFISQKKYRLVVDKYLSIPEQSLIKFNPALLLQVGDAFLMQNENDEALRFYKRVREMNYNEYYIEASAVRTQFLKDKCSPDIFFELYYRLQNDSMKMSFLDSVQNKKIQGASLSYHKALFQSNDSRQKFNNFLQSAQYANDVDIKYFSFVRSANLLYKQLRFEEAKLLYWQAKNYAPLQNLSDFLDERIELCDTIENESR